MIDTPGSSVRGRIRAARACFAHFFSSSTVPLVAALLAVPVVGQVTPRVIVETDMGGDTDDAAMVAFAHRLADQGVIELIAVMHNGNNEWGGAAISAINTYYGRPELPIGTYRTAAEAGRIHYHPLSNPSDASSPRIPLSYTGSSLEGYWVRLLAENFPCRYQTRMAFADAVDVYRQVLAQAPNDSVVIVNGGFLGNLSNVIATFDVDPAFRSLFQAKVHRKTGAVGGVNTCDAGVFPPGMAEYVLNNPVYGTATASWFGGPTISNDTFGTDQSFGQRLPIDNPVRASYRYKTEVEHNRRHTPLAWHWHIIDVITGFSLIAWDELRDPTGVRYFNTSPGQWLDVTSNCGGVIFGGSPQVPHWDFVPSGANIAAGETAADAESRIRHRVLDDGIYAAPQNAWAPEREHLSITAAFDDGTYGGFHLGAHHPDVRAEQGKLIVPTAPVAAGATTLTTEGRRYFDQTFVARVGRVPNPTSYPVQDTTAVRFEMHFWADDRTRYRWGESPLLRIIAWPRRGYPASSGPGLDPGAAVYRAEIWSPSPSGYVQIAGKNLVSTAVGEPFAVRLQVQSGAVQAFVNSEPVTSQPMVLPTQPPVDGGMLLLHFSGICPSAEQWEVDYAMLRPNGGYDTQPDVYVDKAGTVWFSYVKNGSSFIQDMFTSEGGLSGHFVDMELRARPGWPQDVAGRFLWSHPNPAVPDWLDLVRSMSLEGLGDDHWVYALRGFPWRPGDSITLEYRGWREGEQVPRAF